MSGEQPFVAAPDNPAASRKGLSNLSTRSKAAILISICCAAVVCAAVAVSTSSFASTASADKTQLTVSRTADGDLEFGFEDWQVVLQQSTLLITGAIPIAGPIIGFFIALFWPSSNDIWGMIKERVLELVTQELLKQEVRDLHNDLLGLKDSLDRVNNAGVHEKGNFIDSLIISCDNIWAHIRGSSDPKQVLPIFAPFAYIHLGVLNERYRCGDVLFPEDHNEEGWRRDLETQRNTYGEWFAKTYQEWYDWRIPALGFNCERQVGCGPKVPCVCNFHVTFTDSLLGTHEQETVSCQYNSGFCAQMEQKQQQRINDVIAEMEKKIVYARHLDVFLPKTSPEYCAIRQV
eukprot:c2899_g1_i1.p1 GENE.c2899_g1_i1~~c2899_g1_i1.p1  ORF type:complete len:354 (+),score=76.02 c2899_g1_i1:23-1063(+)